MGIVYDLWISLFDDEALFYATMGRFDERVGPQSALPAVGNIG